MTTGWRRAVARGLAAAALAFSIAIAAHLTSLTGTTRQHLAAADDASQEAAASLRQGDLDATESALRRAADAANLAGEQLRSGPLTVATALPLVGERIRAFRAAADAAAALAIIAADTVEAVGGVGIRNLIPADGAFDTHALTDLARVLGTAEHRARQVQRGLQEDVRAISPSSVGDAAVQTSARRIRELASTLNTLRRLLEALTTFAGSEGPRRYFVAAQNPAELRGTGGLIGAYAILTLDHGHVSLGPFTPIQDLPEIPVGAIVPPSAWFRERYDRFGGAGFWRNLNMTSDFPTAADAIESLYQRVTGERLDGTIAVDPFTLRQLMLLTGPVSVPGLGDVHADGVVALLANEAFGRLRDPDERKALLGTVAGAALAQLFSGGVADSSAGLRTLSQAVMDRHLLIHSAHDDEQAAFDQAGLTGSLGGGFGGDFAAVVANNASENKLDFYMRRRVDYLVGLQADGSADSLLRATFTNTAPTTGPPRYVIGPLVEGLAAGELAQQVDLLCAPGCALQEFHHSPTFADPRVEEDAGHPTHFGYGRVPSGAQAWTSSRRMLPDAWRWEEGVGIYDLLIPVQPTAQPTTTTVRVEVPGGSRITRTAPYLPGVLDRRAVFTVRGTGGTIRIRVEFEPS